MRPDFLILAVVFIIVGIALQRQKIPPAIGPALGAMRPRSGWRRRAAGIILIVCGLTVLFMWVAGG
jgi:hypothetical protein